MNSHTRSNATEVCIFIGCWIAMWLLFTLIGWFATPGVSFREVAGHPMVGFITVFLGWIPGAAILSD